MNRLVLFLLLAGLGACRKSDQVDCPSGMKADPTRSMPGRHLWCKDDGGRGARYVEFHPGRKQPRQICEFRDGRPAGSYSAWLPGGQPWITGQYLAGQPDGRWEQLDSSGKKAAEGVYRNGQLIAGVPVAGTAACERMAERGPEGRPR
jgi:hypothetical protein